MARREDNKAGVRAVTTVSEVPRVLAPLARRMVAEHAAPPFRRDPAFIARFVPVLALYSRYFSPEVRGLANLPATGPVLVVGNHSGLFYLPDASIITQAILTRRGLAAPAYVLTYDLLLAVPAYGALLRKLGAIPAGSDEADAALDRQALVLVFPGGDWESSRPWSHRNRVDLAGRHGFVQLALRHQVPVVPVVSHGAQHTIVVLSRGDRLARLMGLQGIHIHVFPIVVSPPFGVGAIVTPPLPARITVEFLPPLDWSDRGPADDPEVSAACYAEVEQVMQAAIDRLADEIRHPVVSGSVALARQLATAPFRARRRS